MGTFAEYTGSMSIREDKRDRFNEDMEKILRYSGMMQFDSVKMHGKEIYLIKPVEFMDEGRSEFHYNYFEDDPWESAAYNKNNTYLSSNKIGGREFHSAIVAAYSLYEAYDNELDYAEVDGDVIGNGFYIGWINNITGNHFSLEKRAQLWDNLERENVRRIKEYETDPKNFDYILELIPVWMRRGVGGAELADILNISHGTKHLEESELKTGTYPRDVLDCKNSLKDFLLEDGVPSTDKIEILKSFLKEDRSGRKQCDKALEDIAELSMYMPARVFMYLTAEMCELDFWTEWLEIKNEVYHDEKMRQYASKELLKNRREIVQQPIPPIKTSTFLREDGYFTFWDTPEELKDKPNYYISDDDRLYWFGESDEVAPSEKLLGWVVDLKKQYDEILSSMTDEDYDKGDFLFELVDVLHKANEYYKRIYAFQDMFYEFIQNGRDKRYIAAIRLFEKLCEEYKEEGKVIEHVKHSWDLTSKNVTFNEGRIKIKRYLSIMANKKFRKTHFGF